MLKNLKSLFIVEEESDAQPKAKGKDQSKAKKPSTSKATAPAGPQKKESTSGHRGKVQSKFTDTLLGAMEAANLDGFDYLEYKRSMQSLKKMSMDEATIYQSAFAMAQTMGATPAKLIETAQHYLDVLQAEEAKFEKALSNQKDKRIGSKQTKQAKLQQTIKDKEARIQQLQEEIKQHQTELGQLDSEIKSAVEKVESTKNDFIATYNLLVKQIANDLENMKKYLK